MNAFRIRDITLDSLKNREAYLMTRTMFINPNLLRRQLTLCIDISVQAQDHLFKVAISSPI
ncbi:hypothetical protein XBFM1_380002 [Xenorhabdus bovienii str. feltiae Moldova]|uniref:Uncharacterized protein n=2 Tax=Xenorhabdus bovienii TaxID=40576 RepID=A0A077PS38_XENBV|nr:hypothetical protein XBFM1_380002 [Xenorhabdus bovienii str. feltiae Moldova]CDH23397.1 hypothetical protein XBKB1_1780002 [Xenorhabdus bovienii str. kraussei Becker Underwood]